MDDVEKLKIRNTVDQQINYAIDKLGITDPEEKMQHYERVCIAIVDASNEEDEAELTLILQEFLQDKANSLGVVRDYF
jgi:hypothetical protein